MREFSAGGSECFLEGEINQRVLNLTYSDSSISAEGPLEVCINGEYESICDIGWDRVDAQAACRYLFSGRDYGKLL